MTPTSRLGFTAYNPDLLSEEEVRRLFVARTGLLEGLLADLRYSGTTQHHLLVGQRGMGKTMLLRRLKGAIREDEGLRARWMPLVFPEEQYNVAHLSDFWINCLDALGDALEEDGDLDAVHRLDSQVDALPDDPEEVRAAAALGQLTVWSDAHRGLVLLLDNADLVMRRLTEQQWVLREALSAHERLVIIAATANPIEGINDYGAAFYDFFRLHELRGFDLDQTRELLLRLTEIHDTPAVARIIQDQPGRLMALHVLCGGNPRTLVLLFRTLADDDQGDIRSDVERLLDLVTPLYKARFENLPPQAQQIVDALAIHWDPMTSAQAAAKTRLDVGIVSAQLSRLAEQGVVEKVPLPKGSRAGFQVGERFFNIWYLMRASRRVRRRLTWLVKFLEGLYGRPQMRAKAMKMLQEGSADGSDACRQAEMAFAYACLVDDPALSRALDCMGLNLLQEKSPSPWHRLAESFDLEGEDRSVLPLVQRMEILAQGKAAIWRADVDWTAVGCTASTFWDLLSSNAYMTSQEKLDYSSTVGSDVDQVKGMVKSLEGQATQFARDSGPEAWGVLRGALQEGWMEDIRDVDGADATALRTGCQTIRAMSRQVFMRGRGSDEECIAAVRPFLEGCASPGVWCVLADQFGRVGLVDDVEDTIRRAIALDGQYTEAWYRLGMSLKDIEGRDDEAESALREAIRLDESHAPAWHGLSHVLSKKSRWSDEAADCLRKATDLEPSEWQHWLCLGRLLGRHEGHLSEAEAALRRALGVEQNNPEALFELGEVLDRSDRFPEAEAALRRSADLGYSRAWSSLAFLYTHGLPNDLEKALNVARMATEVSPSHPCSWCALATALKRQNREPGEQEAAWRKVIELVPKYALPERALAIFLLKANKDLPEAEVHARRALELEPDGRCNTILLARILLARGEWNEAAGTLENLLCSEDLNPSSMDWEGVLVFFREAVHTGFAAQVVELLDVTGTGDRWRPLREAVQGAALGDPSYLLSVAPEVRSPAAQLMDEIWPIDERPKVSIETKKRPARRRKGF